MIKDLRIQSIIFLHHRTRILHFLISTLCTFIIINILKYFLRKCCLSQVVLLTFQFSWDLVTTIYNHCNIKLALMAVWQECLSTIIVGCSLSLCSYKCIFQPAASVVVSSFEILIPTLTGEIYYPFLSKMENIYWK